MRSALDMPPFGEFTDPALVARLCAEAEEAGWHGVFVWDHVRWHEPVGDTADTQTVLGRELALRDVIQAGVLDVADAVSDPGGRDGGCRGTRADPTLVSAGDVENP